jgi:hypothetical protein
LSVVGFSTDNLQLTTVYGYPSARHPTLPACDFVKLLPFAGDPKFIMARLTEQ